MQWRSGPAGRYRIYAYKLILIAFAPDHLATRDDSQKEHRGAECQQSHQDDKSTPRFDFKTHELTHIVRNFSLSYWDFSPNDSLRLKLSRQSPVLCSSRSLAPVYHSLAQIRQSYRRRDWPPACYRIQEVTGALPRRQKARGGVALAAGAVAAAFFARM